MNSTERGKQGLGIDVGGSGIKGAVVNLQTGDFVGDRMKIATPQPATPDAIAGVVAQIIEHFSWSGPVGITLPSVIRNQIAKSAANIDSSWIGTDVQKLFGQATNGQPIVVLNDADAAGLAEVAYGLPEAKDGSAVFLTFGTGIGSALLTSGKLFPNTELGHLLVHGKEAEHLASSAVKERKNLSFKKWAQRVNRVLLEYEKLINPDYFIVGGGISRKSEKWLPYLSVETPVVAAQLRNRAGIVGAALAAHMQLRP